MSCFSFLPHAWCFYFYFIYIYYLHLFHNYKNSAFFFASPAGDELTWLTPSLGVWYSGLLQRDSQYRLWLSTGRPLAFWMTGFFNPQGFLTAVQQEITRAHKHENWALDSVVLHSEVTDLTADHVKTTPRVSGLFFIDA